MYNKSKHIYLLHISKHLFLRGKFIEFMFCDLFFNSKSVSMKILRQSDPPYPNFFSVFGGIRFIVGPIYYKFCLVSMHVHGLAYLPKMLSRLIWLNRLKGWSFIL